MAHHFGVRGRLLSLAALFGAAQGACIAYLNICGDAFPAAFVGFGLSEKSIFASRSFTILVLAVFVMLPISSVKNMSSLGNTSAISVAGVVFYIIVLTVQAHLHKSTEPIQYKVINRNCLPAIGTMAFAFVCQHSSFVHFDSMKVKSVRGFAKASHAAVAFAAIVCLFIAMVGYAAFGENTKANLFRNFPERGPGSFWTNLARLVFAVTLLLTYPLELFISRECIDGILAVMGKVEQGGTHSSLGSVSHIDESSTMAEPTLGTVSTQSIQRLTSAGFVFDARRHYTITVVLVAFTTLIALAVKNLGLILEFSGSFSAVTVAFVLPALAHLKSKDALRWDRASMRREWGGWCMLVSGIVVAVLSTMLILWNVFRGEQKGE